MSECKHTPGPWIARKSHEDADGPMFDIDPDEREYYDSRPYTRIYGSSGHNVTMASDLDTMTDADARLIAGAPELLEDCRALSESLAELSSLISNGQFDAAEDWVYANTDAILGVAAETIAKATGEQK